MINQYTSKKTDYVLFSLSFLLWILLPQPSSGQSWVEKVNPDLLYRAQNGETVDFLIIMKEQADVSKAELFLLKEDKIKYVTKQLKATAYLTQTRVLQLLEAHQASYRAFFLINALWAEGQLPLLQSLAQLPEVLEIQANPPIPLRLPSSAAEAPSNSRAIEWGIIQIQANSVWNLGHKGNGVVVGGQDTGVEWDHPAIKEQYRGWNGNTANHNYNWHDAIHSAGGSNPCGSDSPVPCDDHNHGTHVTGTMVGDDGGSNQIGVAPEAQWIACRNMDQGVGTPATYIECFEWFLEPTDLNDANPDASKAPDVINNSWGCPPSEGCNSGNYATMDAVVNNLIAAGIVVVVSAGNSGPNCSSVDDPAAIFEGSFTVGATQNNDSIANFSSRGPVTVDGSNRLKPDISAPGVGVRSCIRNGNYATWSGTSMAGPHVVGTVALMLSARPDMKGQVATIENIIEQNALQLTSSQSCGGTSGNNIPNNTYGYGRINALAAVQAIIALPIELISFEAQCNEQKTIIHWTTASETNFSHYQLLRSLDLEQWEKIGTITPSPSGKYQFTDPKSPVNTSYYRLKMFDQDGSFEFSKIITAYCSSAQTSSEKPFRLSPNPTPALLQLQYSGQAPYSLSLYSLDGRRLLHLDRIQATAYTLSLQNFPSGCYLLYLQTPANRQVEKVVVNH